MRKTMKRFLFLMIATAMCLTQMHVPLKVQAAVENLALHQKVSVSGLEVAGRFTGDKAVDGEREDRESRWSSGNVSSPQWLSVDFGKPVTFNAVKIFWEASAGKSYQLQISDDNQTWTDIYATEDGPGGTDVIQLAESHTAQYLRIYITEGNGAYWSVSIFEFEVYQYSTEAVLEDAQSEISVPKNAKDDFQLPIRSSLGAEITWTSDVPDVISVNNATGQATLTKPEENTSVTLTATISYNNESITNKYSVNVLSEESINATYQIYPTPQYMEMTYHKITLSAQINVVMGAQINEGTKQRIIEVLEKHGRTPEFTAAAVAGQTNLYVGVNGSSDAADVYANEHGIDKEVFTKTENCFDNHLLSINEDNTIVILGKDSDATYYALATLDQVLAKEENGKIATAIFEDYANTQYRGIVEGFYGFPYSIDDRLSLLDYMKDYKMNTFIYGPKADPYHLGNWKDDYPLTLSDAQRKNGQITQDDLREIARKAAENNIDFVWSAHPAMQEGIDFTTDAGVNAGVAALMKKYEHLYELGIRQFGIFVDDIDLKDAYRDRANHAKLIDLTQKAIDAQFNGEGTEESEQVQPLFFVPSFYALDFGSTSQREEYLRTLRSVDEKIIITFTGAGCWSNISNNPLVTMKNLIGRTPAMWWNYPVNDNIDDQLYMNPINSAYSVSNDTKDFQGLMSNPMNQAEASKLSLFGVADFSWHPSAFNAQENWEHSFATYSADPKIQNAIRTFSLHSGKTKDFSGINAMYDKFKADIAAGRVPANADELQNKMKEIIDACDTILSLASGEDQKLAKFAAEVRPWVNKLRAMARIIDDSITVLTSDLVDDKWAAYTEANEIYATLHTSPDHKVNSLEGQGTSVTPSQFEVMPGEVYTRPFTDYIIKKAQAEFSALPQRGDMEVYTNIEEVSATLSDQKGTVKLLGDAPVDMQPAAYIGVNLHTVKAISSTCKLPEGLVLEGSFNGKEWFALDAADLPVDAVYVRVKNASSNPVTFDVNEFIITYRIGTEITKTEASMKLYETHSYPISNLTDGNPQTYLWTGVDQAPGQTITLTLDKMTALRDITLIFSGADCLNEEAVLEISSDKADWETIGTVTRADLDQNEYIYELDATGKSAQYVRLRITKVSTNAWLKFYEFAINSKADQMLATPIAYEVNNDVLSPAMEIADRNISTKYTMKENSVLTYQLIENKKISKINLLYRYSGSEADASVIEVLDQEGWQPLGRLDGTTNSFDVAQYHNLKAVRVISKDQPAEIYEIYEEGSAYQEADRTELKMAIATGPDKEESAYTAESYANYKKALQEAQKAFAAAELTEEEADAIVAKLTEALASLQIKTEDTTVSRGILKTAIDKASAAVESEAFTKLPETVQTLITEALQNAQTVYASETTNDAYIAAWLNLADAMHYLDFMADKTALYDMIQLAKSLDMDEYSAGVETFNEALKNAEEVYADKTALQERIDNACNTLETAMNALIKDEDTGKDTLEAMIAYGKQLDLSKYRDNDALKAFKKAMEHAEAVLADGNASKEQIHEATLQLSNAYEDIRLLPDEEMLKQLGAFITTVEHIDLSKYSEQHVAKILAVAEKAQMMLNDPNLYDESIMKEIQETEKIIKEEVLQPETPEKPETPDKPQDPSKEPAPETSANNGSANTGDATNMLSLMGLLMFSGAVLFTADRKRKANR